MSERPKCARCGKQSTTPGDWGECFTVCDSCWDAEKAEAEVERLRTRLELVAAVTEDDAAENERLRAVVEPARKALDELELHRPNIVSGPLCTLDLVIEELTDALAALDGGDDE